MNGFECFGIAVANVTISKVMMTVLLVVWWLYGPSVGYYPVGETDGHTIGTLWEHIFWPLSHANIWHLAGNLWVLWWLKDERLYIRECYVMSVLCSFVPVVPGLWEMIGDGENAAGMHDGAVATCGFSGVLCGMIGVIWGRWIRKCHDLACSQANGQKGRGSAGTYYWTFAKRVLPFVAVGFVIPHVNWSIHLYCLLAGVMYGNLSGKTAEHTVLDADR